MTEPGWLVWVGSVGIALIVSTSRVFRPLREGLSRRKPTRWLGALLSCSMCVGFWVGVASSWCAGHRGVASFLWSGGAVSLLSYSLDLLLVRLAAGRD